MQSLELLFATGNTSKLAQLAFVIETLSSPVTLVPARERYGDAARYTEIGATGSDIARRGALEVAARIGEPVFTEDTTLHVAALDGRPGIHARAYLLEHGRQSLLRELDGIVDRYAEITSALAWATPEGDLRVWVRVLPGRIAAQERYGTGMPSWVAPQPDLPDGGGYNAVFIPLGETRTLAEIPPVEGLQLGYREPNFRAAVDFLRHYARPHAR
jgi:XTP/dITP diphosphohydrolase